MGSLTDTGHKPQVKEGVLAGATAMCARRPRFRLILGGVLQN